MTSSVQWESTVTTLLEKGVVESYELGPGKVKLEGKEKEEKEREVC